MGPTRPTKSPFLISRQIKITPLNLNRSGDFNLLRMDYLQIYDDLVNKALSSKRVKLNKNDKDYIYYEYHHVVPKCLGGVYDVSNLVLLTVQKIVREKEVLRYERT